METNLDTIYKDEYYVGRDVFGHPYNKKYPPDFQKFGRLQLTYILMKY